MPPSRGGAKRGSLRVQATRVARAQKERGQECYAIYFGPSDSARDVLGTRTRKLSREPAACEGGTLENSFVGFEFTKMS